jgi:hypothetical protein
MKSCIHGSSRVDNVIRLLRIAGAGCNWAGSETPEAIHKETLEGLVLVRLCVYAPLSQPASPSRVFCVWSCCPVMLKQACRAVAIPAVTYQGAYIGETLAWLLVTALKD